LKPKSTVVALGALLALSLLSPPAMADGCVKHINCIVIVQPRPHIERRVYREAHVKAVAAAPVIAVKPPCPPGPCAVDLHIIRFVECIFVSGVKYWRYETAERGFVKTLYPQPYPQSLLRDHGDGRPFEWTRPLG